MFQKLAFPLMILFSWTAQAQTAEDFGHHFCTAITQGYFGASQQILDLKAQLRKGVDETQAKRLRELLKDQYEVRSSIQADFQNCEEQ